MNAQPIRTLTEPSSKIEIQLQQINHLLDTSFTQLKDLDGILSIFLAPARNGDSCLGECDSTIADSRSTLLKELSDIADRVSLLNQRIDNIDSRVIN